MNIEYIDGEMVVTHDSGHVDRYNQQRVNDIVDELILRKVKMQSRIDELQIILSNMQASVTP